ncbi:hypothetical protein AKUA2003_07630 [Apilactobacillus kunkeei]|nr:hypothetical protein AKUA1001_07650 [Apilactobacillus kunkeei]CAI2601730.1 hypothetical protein AKUA2003_07630 [Apilactobacillus kunkeei]CAI2802302.1 hypothetical protein AKUA2002_07650 [Apilactobacillus kunkeei]
MEKAKEKKLFKYLFILLMVALLGGAVYAWKQMNSDVVNPQIGTPTKNNTPISVNLNKKQINALSSYYLEKFEKKEKNMDYKFWVDKQAYVYGKITILGSKVGYLLSLDPHLLSNGDVELTASKLEVGKLNVPPRFVIGYVGKHYKIPKWVELDSKNSRIILHVNKLGGRNELSYQANKIDMNGEGDFDFKVLIPNQ